MKTRLLKKIRKRFVITHFPKGVVDSWGKHHDCNFFELKDNDNEFFALCVQCKIQPYRYCNEVFDTEKECIDFLKNRIIERLRASGYRGRKDKIIKKSERKIWWVKN